MTCKALGAGRRLQQGCGARLAGRVEGASRAACRATVRLREAMVRVPTCARVVLLSCAAPTGELNLSTGWYRPKA